MHSRGWLYTFLKLVVVIAFTIAGAACTSSGISSTPVVTATPTVIAPTATPTPTPAGGPSPTATPIAAGFSLTPGHMAAMGRSSYAEAELNSGQVLVVGGMDINANVLATRRSIQSRHRQIPVYGGIDAGPAISAQRHAFD